MLIQGNTVLEGKRTHFGGKTTILPRPTSPEPLVPCPPASTVDPVPDLAAKPTYTDEPVAPDSPTTRPSSPLAAALASPPRRPGRRARARPRRDGALPAAAPAQATATLTN